ncbi:hypothetical protein E4665_12660 [Sporolactobacillus shoreae]|uniref:Anti-sigma factor RsgI-like middle domain-containing protein n=1 Tax=Sporolactobacillus shoreae TaxID=1465501 RepID=A0A4Z0GM17_9BACL|nr:anti-sigma factor domain-containing protein [Sporolactobacillus shoreae]TGA97242.1 hypothetical protein E4665_12660 [Sporolactobacillus shoreae]
MSRHGRRAIILTNEGDFQSVRLRRSAKLSIGQTVHSEHLSQFRTVRRFLLAPVMAIGLSALCLAPLSQSAIAPGRSVAAYVNFDLGPSIEAGVGKDFRIISVRPMGKEASEIVPDPSSFNGMTFKEFSSALIHRMNQCGKLSRGSHFLISTAFTNLVPGYQRLSFSDALFHAFTSSSSRLLNEGGIASQWIRSTMYDRAMAQKKGISTGKYFLYLQANARGSGLTLSKVKKLSVSAIEEATPALTVPWRTIMNEISPNRNHQSLIEGASFNIRNSSPLFQDPFQNLKQSRSDNRSSYLFPKGASFQMTAAERREA